MQKRKKNADGEEEAEESENTHVRHARQRRTAFGIPVYNTVGTVYHARARANAAIPEIDAFMNYYYTCLDN